MYLGLLTGDPASRQNKWIWLTNECINPKGSTLLFPEDKAAILAIPLRPDVTNGLVFRVADESFGDVSFSTVKWQWMSASNGLAPMAPAQWNLPGAWRGWTPDIDRGFTDCLITSSQPGNNGEGVVLWPLQFIATNGVFDNIKGIAEVRIRTAGFPDLVYQFGIQFVSDENQAAYVVEEAINRDGVAIDFLPPHRSHGKKGN